MPVVYLPCWAEVRKCTCTFTRLGQASLQLNNKLTLVPPPSPASTLLPAWHLKSVQSGSRSHSATCLCTL